MLETFVHGGWGRVCTDSVHCPGARVHKETPSQTHRPKAAEPPLCLGQERAEGTQPAFDKVTEPMAASCAERVRTAPRPGAALDLQRQGDHCDPSKQGDVHVCN